MVKLKNSEIRFVDQLFQSDPGYVLDFSNATFAEFFEDELGVDIYGDEFSGGGNSKANRLRTFLKKSSARQSVKALRALWKHKNRDAIAQNERNARLVGLECMDVEAAEMQSLPYNLATEEFEEFLANLIGRNEDSSIGDAHAIATKFDFDTVLDEIERARAFIEDDPEDAITAACSLVESVCRSILVELNLPLPKDLSVAPLYRAVREPLGLSPDKDLPDSRNVDDVRTVLAGISNAVGGIGALRTHSGDAHGREKGTARVDARIARLAVSSASALAVFLIESWDRKHPKRELRNADAGA